MQQARLAGYRVQLVFMILANAELHVQRVRDRVMKGGHDIPADTIRRRYDVAFANLEKAVGLSEEVAIFDNSDQTGPRICVEIREGRIERNSLYGTRELDSRIASCVASALGLPVGAILLGAK